MKKPNSGQAKWGLTAFTVIAACILFYFFLLRLDTIVGFFKKIISILSPVLLGIVIAYLINPMVVSIESWLRRRFEKTRMKNKTIYRWSRSLSITLGMLVFLAFLTAFAFLIVPQVIDTVTSLATTIMRSYASYSGTVMHFVETRFASNPEIQTAIISALSSATANITTWVTELLAQTSSLMNLASGITSSIMGVFNVLLNLIVGVAVAVYVLYSKEKFFGQAKKITYMFHTPEKANVIITITRQANKIFGGFITGKIIDSIIIGILCFICMTIFRFPYPLLISLIIGVTNIIPFFGPFIGAIPSAFLILLTDPIKCIWFLFFVFLLQQLDGNVIGPKILGDSTGLSSFWVIVSILLGKGLFGFAGMLLGVPTFALIYYLIRCLIEIKLRHKGLPPDTEKYSSLDRIDPETGTFLYIPEDVLSKSNRAKRQELTYSFEEALDTMYKTKGVDLPDEIKLDNECRPNEVDRPETLEETLADLKRQFEEFKEMNPETPAEPHEVTEQPAKNESKHKIKTIHSKVASKKTAQKKKKEPEMMAHTSTADLLSRR